VGANRDVWIELPDEFYQGPCVQSVEHETHTIRFPGFVALLVPPPEEVRCVFHEASVKLGIEVSEQLIRETKRITMENLAYPGVLLENLG
jgi:hypothetical protein